MFIFFYLALVCNLYPFCLGTGTCQLPTTVQVLQSYFNDPISKVIFTNHLGYGTQEKMDNLRQLGLLMADYKSEFSNQEDPSLINICSKVRPSTFYKHILKNPIHWKLNTELVKPEFKNSPLLDWIQIRINWAIDKQQYIKELYRQKMANVHVGAWTNSWSTPQPSVPRPKEEDEDSSSSDEPETDNSPLVKDSPGKFFSTLADEVFARGIVNVNINFSSMPNTNFRFSRFPVQTDEYNVLLSDGYNTPSVTCVETFTIKPHQLNIKQANLFTYHRYWALYYIKLLDRFIQAHMEICRAMTVHDLPFQVNMKPRNKDEDDPMVQLKQFHVPTVFQPFDEAYAKWDWIPLQGHQGSFAILKSLFPSEFIFHYSLYDLYRIMTKSTNLTQDETYIVKTIKEIANQLYANWSIMPLLPPSLLPKEDEWLPPQPFTKNNYFLWTFFVVVGRLEQLKQEVKGMVFPSDNEPPVSPKQTRREMEIDFRLHQIQVRQTGYLATSRWIMSELILDHDDDPIKKQLQKDGKWTFGDDSIPESVLYFPYEEADFDAELDMIDFVPYLQKLNFWRRISLESRQNILLLPLQKGIAFRSHGRVIADFFLKIMQYKNVRYMTYLQLFIISSGFGLYRRTPEGPEMFRPSFQGLVKIDFALLQSPKTLFNFIHVSTSKVLSYMNRETLVNQVLKVPHIHKHHVLDWEQFEQNTWKVQNLIRRHLEYNKFWLQAPHNPARVTLEERIHVYEKQYTILLFHLYDFNHQMQKHFYNEHINHLDKIISLNVQLEGWKTKLKFLLLEQIEKEADAMDIDGDPTVMPVMAKETSQSLREKIEKTTIELSMINYELPEQIRSTIWQSLLGYRKDIDIWTVICQWLKDDDLLLFQRLKNAYDNFLSRAKINEIVSQFSIPAFTMIRFLLDVQITLHRVKIIPITKSMAQQIHHAMRTKRHHLFDNQPILSSVYMVYMTFCCNNLITFAGNNSYGNDQLTFIRQLNYFGCCQKKTKKDRDKGGIQKETDQSDDDSDMEEEDELSDDEQEGGSTTDAKRTQTQIIMGLHTGKAGPMEEYPNMVIKARRKIARRYDNELRTLRCHANPPVLALNLRGLRLYYGSIEFATRASQHCPRCGDLHLFTDKNFNSGRGYMCPNCIQKTWQPSFAMQRQMFCAYCGRQHFKDVEHGLETIPMYDVFDVQEPIKILQLCHNDMPKHHGDFFTESTVPDIKLPFIDTYLKRHNNLVRSTAIAQFPMQNTIDNNLNGLKINNNGFSWIRYGLRIHMIPQPVDVWWPHPKRKLLAKKK